jgi:transcriptional regulator with GAF, ATPase, and Fis domain
MAVQPSPKADILLSLSIKIARAKTKDELLTVINTELSHILPFDDCMILRYNNTNKTAQSYISSANGRYYNIDHPVVDDSLSDAHTPILNYMSSLFPMLDDDVSAAENPGMKQCVTIKLIDGVVLIGFWVVLFAPHQACDQEMFEILRKISYPIAIATANIIATEDSFRNEEEKNKLLLLSNEIATIKKREDLPHFVNGLIEKMFAVTEFGIAYVHEDGQFYGAFHMELGSGIRGLEEFEEITSAKYNVTDAVFKMITESEEPILLNIDELLTKPGIPAYVRFWKSAGIKEILSVPLRDGRKTVGFVNFHVDGDKTILGKKRLLESVCTQLLMAISNILANEKLQKRDEEKNVLLSLSNEIAALKTREDLSIIVNTRIKKLLSVNEFGIAQIDEGGETYSAFVLDFSDKTRGTPGFHVATSSRYSTSDPIFTKVKNSEDPIWFDVAEVAGQAGMPGYVKFWNEAEHKYYLHVPLRVGGVLVGFVPLHFENMDAAKGKSMLLNGICVRK